MMRYITHCKLRCPKLQMVRQKGQDLETEDEKEDEETVTRQDNSTRAGTAHGDT